MKSYFRIHGDNIIECERIIKLLISRLKPYKQAVHLESPSVISFDIEFSYDEKNYQWNLELLPGFNKAGRARWEKDIFKILKTNGSFLDETPDAIVTKIVDDKEEILYAIEFCSALQAGNQAWQRSGRAYSTGITGCPYIYIVDFVKYELDPKTRERKALRFPNAAVPYSYVNFSIKNDLKVIQAYFKAEEFNKNENEQLKHFNESDFAKEDFQNFIIKLMLGKAVSKEWEQLAQKNINIVQFLAKTNESKRSLTAEQWKQIYNSKLDIIDYAKKISNFKFGKKVADKSCHGNLKSFFELVKKHSVGIASQDLPFGLIPSSNRDAFAKGIEKLYPSYDKTIINNLKATKKDLLICLLKGFKPRGDDNRPDRGALPFALMLVGNNCEIMTFIYGPIVKTNLHLLKDSPAKLAQNNGFWKAILNLSNFVAIDAPVLNEAKEIYEDCQIIKYTPNTPKTRISSATLQPLIGEKFSNKPKGYHEDDVDTAIHYAFSHLLFKTCFEGMCNPPGGDWSGFSVLHKGSEKRWLSLPRVSDDIAGKRPDHIIEIFSCFQKPILLAIESKENSKDLEENVGAKLKEYLKQMMKFIPNVQRVKKGNSFQWERSNSKAPADDFIVISAAAYLSNTAQNDKIVFENSHCEMLFKLTPSNCGWKVNISTKNENAEKLKAFIKNCLKDSSEIIII